MSRIVETNFVSFSIKPLYILSFYYFEKIGLHAIDWNTDKKREYCIRSMEN